MSRSERKWEHIQFALQKGQERSTGLEDIQFIHQSLPDLGVTACSIDHTFGELSLSSPIFINAMTGGGGERTYLLNRDLAQAARKTGLAMAVGSQMSAIKDSGERYTYEIVRKENPAGIIIANLGSEASCDQALMAVEMLEANALQIHLNVIQELTMPEGDRDFTGALKRIEAIVRKVTVPVIVKEVGFGMTRETVKALSMVGVKAIDVGGFGGTNFAEIENNRREHSLSFFNDWGNPTAVSIAEAVCVNGVSVIGSGGINTALDVAKGIALGADAIGLAGFFLKMLIHEGLETLCERIEGLHQELKVIMTALGASSIEELKQAPILISGKTFHWLNQRGIETKKYCQRTIK